MQSLIRYIDETLQNRLKCNRIVHQMNPKEYSVRTEIKPPDMTPQWQIIKNYINLIPRSTATRQGPSFY